MPGLTSRGRIVVLSSRIPLERVQDAQTVRPQHHDQSVSSHHVPARRRPHVRRRRHDLVVGRALELVKNLSHRIANPQAEIPTLDRKSVV